MKKPLTLSQEIAKNLSYYFGKDKRCKGETFCYYSGIKAGKKTQGCFVGRLLAPKDRVKADEYFESYDYSDVSALVRLKDYIGIEIPKIIFDNVVLFVRFQLLHDCEQYWNEEFKLTDEGKIFLKDTIKLYNLDIKDFKKFLK